MNIDTVDWKLIGVCNLRCLHCYGPPKTAKALPLDSLCRLVDKFRKLGVKLIVLTGGEPLLIPYIDLLFEYISCCDMRCALSTNGSFVFEHFESIQRNVYSLNLPIDGSTPEIHSRSRADSQSFFDVIHVLDYYKNNPHIRRPLLRIGTVFSSANSEDFLAMSVLLDKYEAVIDTWKIYEIIDTDIQPELRAPIIPRLGSFAMTMDELSAKSGLVHKIATSPKAGRDRAYFMVNHQGSLIVPTEIRGRTSEVVLGDLLQDNLEQIVGRWRSFVDYDNYESNHKKHYRAA